MRGPPPHTVLHSLISHTTNFHLGYALHTSSSVFCLFAVTRLLFCATLLPVGSVLHKYLKPISYRTALTKLSNLDLIIFCGML